MCGIAGILDPKRHELERTVAAMTATLVHRGPDDDGTWVDEAAGVALGHRRLAIIDLSTAGAQPMASQNERYVLTYNGELYNAPAIAAELGVSLRGHSDTEVLVEAIAAWGLDAALEKINGMFAFALWDKKTRTLSLARDRIGIKPLYWARFGNMVLFGSELKALKAHPAFEPAIDRGALSAFVRFGYVPTPHTIYQGVHKLSPGHVMSFGEGKETVERAFWDLRSYINTAPAIEGTDEALLDGLETLLMDAVKGQMASDVPLGCFLSGGIDSSLVTALMQAQSTQAVKSFSIGFHERDHNEATEAKKVAAHLKTDHTELYVTPEEARAVIPDLARWYDEPFADSSQIPTRIVCNMARKHVTVALSGDGGDEGFAGYNRYFWGARTAARLSGVPLGLRTIGGNLLGGVPGAFWDSLSGVLPRRLSPSKLADKARKMALVLKEPDEQTLYRQLVSQWDRPEAMVLGGREPSSLLMDETLKKDLPDFMDRMRYLDTVTYLPDDILTKVDRASMACSLEVRVPLLDHRVIEHSWALPRRMLVRGGKGKWALRQLLARHVPTAMVERPKQGFGVPIAEWLRGPLKEWGGDLLAADTLGNQGYFDPALAQKLWREHQSGKSDHGFSLWPLLMFQSWLHAAEGGG